MRSTRLTTRLRCHPEAPVTVQVKDGEGGRAGEAPTRRPPRHAAVRAGGGDPAQPGRDQQDAGAGRAPPSRPARPKHVQ